LETQLSTKMELPIHRFQTIKTGIHIFQGFLIFIAWAMTIAVFRTGNVDGKLGWEFGLCFLSIPGLIFLTMTPRFPRTKKLAHPYALLTVDSIYTILWISGFSSVASWSSAGKCTKNCGLSKVVVALGVFIFLFFALTTAMSAYGIKYYRTNGMLPGASRAPYGSSTIDPDKEAFSTAPHDDEYVPVQNQDHESDMQDHDTVVDSDRFDHTSYNGYVPQHEHESELSHESSYSGASESRVHFPPANYVEGRTPLHI